MLLALTSPASSGSRVRRYSPSHKESWHGWTNGPYRLEFRLGAGGNYFVGQEAVEHPAYAPAWAGVSADAEDDYDPGTEVAAGYYRLIRGGKVSLGVYDSGRLIRTLKAGETQAAGDYPIVWDGLDDQGNAVANGTYQWRLLRNDGLEAEYLVSTGGNPPYAPYKMWVGSHGTVGSIAVDVDGKRAFVGGTSNENCSAFICWNFDTDAFVWERYQLAGFSFLGGQRMEFAGSTLWVLLQNAVLAPINATTANYTANTAKDVLHPSDTRESPGGIGDFLADRSRLPNGLAVHADFIAISHPYHGNIRYHHPSTVAYLDRDIDVPNCQSIAVMADGTLLVAAGEKIVKVSHPGNVASDFITVSGMNATHVCIDEGRDELWIAEGETWGNTEPTKNRIFKYTLSTGTLQFTLGTEAGRPFGAFDPIHWRNIKDIKCDGYGGLFTIETRPRRTAHWTFSGSTPVLQGQWFGGQQWGNFTATDPADKRISYCNGSSFERMLCEIDYDNRTWTPVAFYEAPNWVTYSEGTEEADSPFPSLTQHEAQWEVIRRNGKTYLATPIGHAGAKMAVIEVDTTTHTLKPILCAGRVQKSNDTYPAWFLSVYPGTPTANIYLYSWSDLNGDGVLDANEYTFIESPGIAGTGHGHIDGNFNAIWPVNVPTPGNNTSIGLYLPNSAASPTAPPIWNWANYSYMPQTIPDEYVATGRTEISGVTKAKDGAVAITIKIHGNPRDDRHGSIWPGNTVGGAKVMRWDKDGNFVFAAGKHGNDNLNGPGEFQVPKRCLGAFKGCVIAQDRRGRQAQAWTDDGLYAGMFFDRYADDGLPFDEVYKQPIGSLGPEPVLPDQIGSTAIETTDGEVIWNPAGRNTAPIYRVNGWDNWERQAGELTIAAPPAEAVRNGTGIPYEIWENIDFTGSPAYTGTSAQIRYGNREMNVSTDTSGLAWPYSTHPFSARWTGRVEPIFTEDYQFVLEYTNAGSTLATARLWINGVEQTTSTTVVTTSTVLSQRKVFPAVALTAGTHVDIMVEYTSSNGTQSPNIHLSWQSFSQERRQVPTTALFAAA